MKDMRTMHYIKRAYFYGGTKVDMRISAVIRG